MYSWIAITRTASIFIIVLLMTACGGGGSDDSANTNNNYGGTGTSGSGNFGTATLSWLPPTENTDGSMLTNLAGYNIYYGTEAGNYTETITVSNGISEYLVDNLPPGNTYYFVITAFDGDGNESEYSTMGSKTIPA